MNNKKVTLQLALTAMMIGLLAYWWKADLASALSILRDQIRSWQFLSALGVLVLAIGFEALRLNYLIKIVFGAGMNFFYLLRLSFLGYFVGSWFPTSVGGDVTKVFYLSKKKDSLPHLITTVLLDRVFGFAAMSFLVVFFGAMWFFRLKSEILFYSLWAGAGFFVFLTLLFVFKQLIFNLLGRLPWKFVNQFVEAFSLVTWKEAAVLFGISILRWGLFIFTNLLLARSLNLNISFWHLALIVPLSEFAYFVPTINGIGAREAIYVTVASMAVMKDQAIALSLSWLACSLFLAFVGAVCFIGKDFFVFPSRGSGKPNGHATHDRQADNVPVSTQTLQEDRQGPAGG